MKIKSITLLVFCQLLYFIAFCQVPFTGGNLVVLSVGDGFSPSINNAAYEEYYIELTPTGGVAQQVAIPSTTAGARSVESGSASSDADLNTSGDGKSLTFPGYDAAIGTATIATAAGIPRVIGQINYSGAISFPCTINSTSIYKTNNFRSVATNDGTGFWTAGTGSGTSGGIFYFPTGTTNATFASPGVAQLSTALTNARVVKIFKGQLFGNANSGSFKDPFSIGAGLPITGSQTYTVLSGLPNSTHDAYSFILFDRDGNGTNDLLYIADISGGLLKYYLNAGTWTAAGSLTYASKGLTGLTGYLDCNYNPVLYMTSGSSGATDNSIYSYTDATSNSTAISGTVPLNATLVITSGGGRIFRGIALAPTQGDLSISSGSTTLSGSYRSIVLTGGTATLSGTNVYVSDSIYVGNGATLICGTSFLKGKKFILASGGTLKIGSPNGITASASSGNIQTTCRTYSSGANYEYNGTAIQVTGNGLPANINNFVINNSTGVSLTNAVTVDGVATFNNGVLTTIASKLLTISATGSATAYSSSSYVNGPIRKTGNAVFVFPTGKNTAYAPISISAPSLTTDQFTAEYYDTNPGSSYNASLKDATIDHISGCEYWMLDRTTGTSTVSVSLTWDSPRSCGVTNVADLIVAHWDPNLATPIWKDMGGTPSGTTTSGTVITTSAVSSFSPFTLASSTGFNPLPVELINFRGQYNINQTIDLSWETASETNCDYFILEKSEDGVNFETVGKVEGAGNSTQLLNYSFLDLEPFSGQNYYRLQQIDFNGRSNISSTIVINTEINIDAIRIYPNPVIENLYLDFNSSKEKTFAIEVFNSNGIKMLDNKTKIIMGRNPYIINFSTFTDGLYTIRITDLMTQQSYSKKIIKQNSN